VVAAPSASKAGAIHYQWEVWITALSSAARRLCCADERAGSGGRRTLRGFMAPRGAGIAVGRGARAIVLTNQHGAVLELTGEQVGLMANLDLSGLAITLK
jgi:hypothetical protein